jgi:hypothetical protein
MFQLSRESHMSSSSNFRLRTLFLALLLVMAGAAGRTQTYNGAIRGAVTDGTGAVLPNASITLTDGATHQVRDSKTDSAGVYIFNALRPSTYSLHVAATGFGSADRTNIGVATQDFLTLDIRLSVTIATDTVQVSAEAPLCG